MLSPSNLTPQQRKILGFLQNKILESGRSPTLREIGRHFGFRSTGTTRDHLASLARKGYIKLTPRQSRSVELMRSAAFRVPILGKIMAGTPDLALEEAEGFLHLDELLPSPDREIFALRVKGESMKDKGITDGDVAIVKKQRLSDAGDVVAALIENEATIKILKKEKAGLFLAPANKDYPEIRAPFEILGKVIAVLKRF